MLNQFRKSDAFDGRIRMRHLESRSRHPPLQDFTYTQCIGLLDSQRVAGATDLVFSTWKITDQIGDLTVKLN